MAWVLTVVNARDSAEIAKRQRAAAEKHHSAQYVETLMDLERQRLTLGRPTRSKCEYCRSDVTTATNQCPNCGGPLT